MYLSATDEYRYPLKHMRQVFVHGRKLSQKHGASIRPCTGTFPNSWRGIFVPWTNTFSRRWGKYLYCGRIPCQEREASIRPWTNNLARCMPSPLLMRGSSKHTRARTHRVNKSFSTCTQQEQQQQHNNYSQQQRAGPTAVTAARSSGGGAAAGAVSYERASPLSCVG